MDENVIEVEEEELEQLITGLIYSWMESSELEVSPATEIQILRRLRYIFRRAVRPDRRMWAMARRLARRTVDQLAGRREL